jgi:hypothetical protein
MFDTPQSLPKEQNKRHPRRTRSQWQDLIQQQASGSLSQPEFCQQNAIALSTFQNWKRKLRVDQSKSTSNQDWLALPLDIPDDTVPIGWDIELELGQGICLRLRRR